MPGELALEASLTAAVTLSRWYRVREKTSQERDASWEMRFVMFAFLSSGIVGAVLVLVAHVSRVNDVTRFPKIVTNQVLNMFLGMLEYAPTLAMVPLALLLLRRTGQSRTDLGVGSPSWKDDIVPAIGLAGAAFGGAIVLAIPFAGLISQHSGLITKVSVQGFPRYYLVEAIFMSAVTAVSEEVLVNAYFITRLEQLGWSSRGALFVSLAFRTSYHIYYGIGFIFTIPLGYFVTRSFQKHRRLNRAIWAHFLYDATLFTISMLH